MENIIMAMQIIGIISFSAAGAMIAIDNEMDIFGVVYLAVITCFGGGIIRDIMCGGAIGRDVPWFFSGEPIAFLYIAISAVTAVFVILIAMIFKRQYVAEEGVVVAINNILDAVGIGAFTAMGTASYMSEGPFVAMLMGVISSIGGSIIRDMMLNTVPFIFRKYIYAVACFLGALVYYLTAYFAGPGKFGEIIASVACIFTVFCVRVLATYFKWNMPKAIDFKKMRDEAKEDTRELVTSGKK